MSDLIRLWRNFSKSSIVKLCAPKRDGSAIARGISEPGGEGAGETLGEEPGELGAEELLRREALTV